MMRSDISRLSRTPRRWLAVPPLQGVVLTALLLAIVVLLTLTVWPSLPAATALLLFLAAVLISAASQGLSTGLLAALAAFGLFDVMFIEPRYALHVARTEDVVTLVAFLAVAGITGLLAGRLREERDDAEGRAAMLEILSRAGGTLAAAETDEAVLNLLAEEVRAISRGVAMVIGVDETDDLQLRAASPGGITPEAADLQSADRALRQQRAQHAALSGGAASMLTFLPFASDPPLVLGHTVIPAAAVDRDYREQAISILVHLAAQSLHRLTLRAAARHERIKAEGAALRAALLASLSHDLRTPLATILGGVTTLRDLHGTLPAAAQADLLTAVEEEAGRLNLHVEKLLQMTRLQSGQTARLDWLDLGEIAVSAVNRARRAWPRAWIMLDLPELPMVRAEPGLLEQAIFNLLENAVRHGKGTIRVAGRAEQDAVTVTVLDDGPGLSPALAEWLESDGLVNGPSGTGLGLPIVKGIMRLHGARIKAVTSPAGNGVELRLAVSEAGPDA